MFDYEQHKIDRLVAADRASQRGARPHLDPVHAAIFTFMGVFFGLEFFSVIAVNELEKPALPIFGFAAVAAGFAFWATRRREASWTDRFNEALDGIESSRRPSRPRG